MNTFLVGAFGDLDGVFFQEFATEHTVNGITINIIEDSDQLLKRQLAFKGQGVYNADHLLYIRKSDYGKPLPAPDGRTQINYDGKEYFIEAAEEQDGLYILSIRRNRAGRS